MDNKTKRDFIIEAHHDNEISINILAQLTGTYSNRIRRDAKKLGVTVRNKSQAQKICVANGIHPTKGTKRSEVTKRKIGRGRADKWNNTSVEERARLSELSKKNWNAKSDQEKQEFHKAAHLAIRRAASEGSKLEKFLFKYLKDSGYSVQYHKEHAIVNGKLQIDLFIPDLNIAIEVDGPSHFEPVWGDKSFRQTKKADHEKTGLILGQGWILIRIQANKNQVSDVYKYSVGDKLVAAIKKIEQDIPDNKEIFIK